MRHPSLLVLALPVLLGVVVYGGDATPGPADRGVAQDVEDPVAELRARLVAGEVQLAWDSAHGYLSSTLDALGIPVSSQTLVFSRTSLQTDRIAPWAPRAIYFNDDVYVAWVQDSPAIEIAAVDPDGDVRFYTLSQVDPEQAVFTPRSTTCLMCHESRAVTGGRPGLIMMSVLVDRLGYPVANVHEGSTSDRTPHAERYGGWYVTGTHGDLPHAGNVRADVLSHEVSDARAFTDAFRYDGVNVTDLGEFFFTEAYLTPHSDLVALLVLTHQVKVHNLIGLVRGETEEALRLEGYQLGSGRGEPDPRTGHLTSTVARVEGPVDRLFRAMMFVDEVGLDAPVRGTSAFAEDFEASGPRIASGSSLRDLDLETRLFRHRMSFLVHSDAFRSLQELPRRLFAERMMRVLDGTEGSHLADHERDVILEILEELEPELVEFGSR